MSKPFNTKLFASAALMVTALIAALVPTPPANAVTACGESGFTAGVSTTAYGTKIQLYTKKASGGGYKHCAKSTRTTAKGTIRVSLYGQNGEGRVTKSTTGSSVYARRTTNLATCGYVQSNGSQFMQVQFNTVYRNCPPLP